ncbi:MAG TPA: hypothetical protein PK619_01905 [bacterium]|nr:hypothetical protein [bacterium]HPN81039.1 hypothetical protein [bacterium]HPW39453.1 hypothetical protein [bacterium]
MNEIKNKNRLIKMMSDLYLLEKQAKELYDDFLITLKDDKARKIISQIRNDEIKHMKMAKALLNLVK